MAIEGTSPLTTLIFEDHKWLVATSSWSIGSKPEQPAQLVYLWGSADGATSDIRFKCSAAELIEFMLANTKDGVCDLREMPKSAKFTGRFGADY